MSRADKKIPPKPTGLSRADNPSIAADPPASSDFPLRGQVETNQSTQTAEAGRESEKAAATTANEQPNQAAYDFGRRTALQFGRDRSTPLEFDAHEAQLAAQWLEQQDFKGAGLSWQKAREAAREAWNQVQDALVGDKPT